MSCLAGMLALAGCRQQATPFDAAITWGEQDLNRLEYTRRLGFASEDEVHQARIRLLEARRAVYCTG